MNDNPEIEKTKESISTDPSGSVAENTAEVQSAENHSEENKIKNETVSSGHADTSGFGNLATGRSILCPDSGHGKKASDSTADRV